MEMIKRILNLIRFRIVEVLYYSTTNTIYLGSKYGGWRFVPDRGLHGGVYVGVGCGEDISFDIELIKHYNPRKVALIDPTPRSIEHVENTLVKKENNRLNEYNDSGLQSIDSYDMNGIDRSSIQFFKKALWNDICKLDFFPPQDKNHVSHSIHNLQDVEETSNNKITVETITLSSVLKEMDVDHIELLKLDIEGAEIEVLEYMIKQNIRPTQICIEFDELGLNKSNLWKRPRRIIRELKRVGYRCVWSNGKTDYLFILNKNRST
jgi:FkbM family methyltransferase